LTTTNKDIALRSVREVLTETLQVSALTNGGIAELSELIIEKIWEDWARAGPMAIVLAMACPVCDQAVPLPPWWVTPHLVIDAHSSWLKLSVAEQPIVGHRCDAMLGAG
jgi:hypothetical protein